MKKSPLPFLRHFFISLLIIFSGWSVLWLTLATQGEQKLSAFLKQSQLRGQDPEISKSGFPFQLHLSVNNFVTAVRAPQGTAMWGIKSSTPLKFSARLWRPTAIHSTLKQHPFVVFDLKGNTPLFSLMVDHADLNYYFRSGTNELAADFSALSLRDVKGNKKELLSVARLSMKKRLSQNGIGLMNADITLNALNIVSHLKNEKEEIQSIAFQGGVENYPTFLAYDSSETGNLVQARVRDLAANNARAYLSTLAITTNALDLNLSGNVRVDAQMRPQGVFTFRVNQLNALLDNVKENKKAALLALLGNPESQNVSLIIEAKEDQLLRNGQPIAGIPTLTNLILAAQKQVVR